MAEEEYFNHCRGGFTLYSTKHFDHMVHPTFALAYFGEDMQKVVDQFWRETSTNVDIVVIPVFAFGSPPRRQLTTPESLAAALETIHLQPGNALTMRYQELARDLGVPWPDRLKEVA
jgi:hypothetical protein